MSSLRTSKEKRTKEKSSEVKSTGAAHAIEEDLVDSEKQREQEHLEKDTEEQEETEHLDENIEVQLNEETSSGKEPKEKRTRGPTTLSKVHSRRMEERKPIVLNVHFQPVGPDDSTLNEFSSFLGTIIARNSRLAPLNYESWRKVPYKKELWKDVKSKLQELLNSGNDYFSTVIGERPPGRAFLYGRGVTRTNLKNGVGCSSSIIVPEELVQSITDKIRKELKDQFDKEMAGYKALFESVMSQVNPTVVEPSENSDSESAQF